MLELRKRGMQTENGKKEGKEKEIKANGEG